MELSAAMFDQIVSHGLGGWLQEWPEMTAPDHPSRGSFTARPPGSAGFLYQNLYDSYVADGAAVATRDAGGRTVHTLSGVCEQEYALSRHGDLIWFATLSDLLKDLLEADGPAVVVEPTELASRALAPEVRVGLWADATEFREAGLEARGPHVSPPSPATPSLKAHAANCVGGVAADWDSQAWFDLDFSVADPSRLLVSVRLQRLG